jgi:hypothetical protein
MPNTLQMTCQKICRSGIYGIHNYTQRENCLRVDILSESNAHIFLRLSIISSSHLPQVIKSSLQVIVDSTVHPTGSFSLNRRLSCRYRLGDCGRRGLDKLSWRAEDQCYLCPGIPPIKQLARVSTSMIGLTWKCRENSLPQSWCRCRFHQEPG